MSKGVFSIIIINIVIVIITIVIVIVTIIIFIVMIVIVSITYLDILGKSYDFSFHCI